MFIPFLAASIVGVALIKLGALSAYVAVLSAALKLVIAVIVVGICFALWRSFSAT